MQLELNQNFKNYIEKFIKEKKYYFDSSMQIQALDFFINENIPLERQLDYLLEFVEQDIDLMNFSDRKILSHIDSDDYFLIFISKNKKKENVFAIKKDKYMFSNIFFYLEKYIKSINYISARTYLFLLKLINR